jgi:hypothetical protein
VSVPELERAGLVRQPLAPTSRCAGEALIIVLRAQRQESTRVTRLKRLSSPAAASA